MPTAEMLRPYVEKLLTEWLQTDKLIIDDDGDVPIHYNSALYYVSLLDREPPLVRVWSIVLRNIKKTPELLDAINEANTTILECRMFWYDDEVRLSGEILAEELQKEELIELCDAISKLADEYDDKLKEKFGGELGYTEPPSQPGSETVDV